MVQAPKCKVCGSAHFGGAHVWPNAKSEHVEMVAPKAFREVVREPRNAQDPRDIEIERLKARIAELEAKSAPPKTADRAAYMREYRANRKASQ